MKKYLLIFSCAFLLNCSNKAEEKKAEIKIEDLETRVNELQLKNDSLAEEIELMKSRDPITFPEAFDSIPNPEEFIVEALKNQPELIPEEGVLGGTMQFINAEILNHRFIWAEFEDGHINGEALYSYKLSENGEPEFEFISEVED